MLRKRCWSQAGRRAGLARLQLGQAALDRLAESDHVGPRWSRRCRCRANSSPWMRGAPDSGLSRLRVGMSWRTSFGTCGRAGLAATDLPLPERAEASPVPGNDGRWLDDHQSGTPIAPDSAQPRPKEPIQRDQLRLLDRTTKDTGLVPKREVPRAEGQSEELEDGR